jgi:molybdopterin/thiamine biosynthesis adenylyltransferase/rhodanese-related sulfurtransferase
MLPELSNAEKARYSRHLVMPEVGDEGQRRLKASSVVVVGAGGLGIPVSVYLAAAGFGRIGIVDGDVVELSNLQRQFLFSEADVGHPKAQLLRSKLFAINPNVRVEAYETKLDSSNAMKVLEPYDIVVDATDNFPSRYLINDACVLLGKPDVYASVFRFDGQASVFSTRDGPCYRCLYPEPPPPESVQSCAEAGVFGVLTGIMGSVQANQALNIALGRDAPLAGKLLLFNGLETSFNELKIRKNPRCPVCGSKPRITKLIDYEEFCGIRRDVHSGIPETDPISLNAAINGGKAPFLLDVREPYEYQLCHIEGAKLIPLGQLPRRLSELDKRSDIVVYCHSGERSASATRLLRSSGFAQVRNLKGGIKAWAEQVDATMPAY